ncbi:MAG: hypothetical protein ACTSWR_03740 [Candidatus Helarchaeota archaeon]
MIKQKYENKRNNLFKRRHLRLTGDRVLDKPVSTFVIYPLPLKFSPSS